MVVLSFVSLIVEFFCDIEVRQLSGFDDFSMDFKGEGSKVFIVDSSTCLDVLLDVLAEGLDDEM